MEANIERSSVVFKNLVFKKKEESLVVHGTVYCTHGPRLLRALAYCQHENSTFKYGESHPENPVFPAHDVISGLSQSAAARGVHDGIASLRYIQTSFAGGGGRLFTTVAPWCSLPLTSRNGCRRRGSARRHYLPSHLWPQPIDLFCSSLPSPLVERLHAWPVCRLSFPVLPSRLPSCSAIFAAPPLSACSVANPVDLLPLAPQLPYLVTTLRPLLVVMARKAPKKSGMLIKSPAGIFILVLLLLRVLAQLFKWRRGG